LLPSELLSTPYVFIFISFPLAFALPFLPVGSVADRLECVEEAVAPTVVSHCTALNSAAYNWFLVWVLEDGPGGWSDWISDCFQKPLGLALVGMGVSADVASIGPPWPSVLADVASVSLAPTVY
jgi:hypothetical protein